MLSKEFLFGLAVSTIVGLATIGFLSFVYAIGFI